MKHRAKISIAALCAIVALLFIFFIKFYTLSSQDPLVYIYTLLVTIFILSRITASFLYSHEHEVDKGYRPTVSFIIPAKNEEGAIANTISKCFESHYPKDRFEVVVVNDGSTDGTWKEISKMNKKFPSLKAINWKENKGKRYAMAEAVRNSTGEIIVQLDSDSYLTPESLVFLVAPFKTAHVGAVSAHTDPANSDENVLTAMQHAYYFMSFRILKAAESFFDTVLCCSGCCSAYRREAILPALDEWVDERFFGIKVTWGDDRALTNHVLRAGYDTLYSEDVQAHTIVPHTLSKFLLQQVRWKKGWLINSLKVMPFILKNHRFLSATYFIPLFIITLITPIVAFKALVLNPLFFGISPIFYILGVLFVSALMSVNCFLYREEKYASYLFLWSALNMFAISYLTLYAILDLRNSKWGTR